LKIWEEGMGIAPPGLEAEAQIGGKKDISGENFIEE
jgi:hypothetical protein